MNYIDKIIAESIDEELYNVRNSINTNPTEKQKVAGNYKKGHIKINGYQITIENPKGSYRSGKDKKGHVWRTQMMHDYGYFTKTRGHDGDQIDVFIGDDLESEKIFVVDQKVRGKFDESKVMFCFDTIDNAKQGYLDCYEDGWKGFWKITPVSADVFRKWLYDGCKQRKPFYQYVDIIKANKKEKMKKTINESQLRNIIKCVVQEAYKSKLLDRLSREHGGVKYPYIDSELTDDEIGDELHHWYNMPEYRLDFNDGTHRALNLSPEHKKIYRDGSPEINRRWREHNGTTPDKYQREYHWSNDEAGRMMRYPVTNGLEGSEKKYGLNPLNKTEADYDTLFDRNGRSKGDPFLNWRQEYPQDKSVTPYNYNTNRLNRVKMDYATRHMSDRDKKDYMMGHMDPRRIKDMER